MRRTMLTLLAALLAVPAASLAQSPQQQQQTPPQSAAEAARKAREARKGAPPAKRVFTNDDVQGKGGRVSVVGDAAAQPAPGKAEQKTEGDDEAAWRARFAEARERLRTAERELDILQRELNLLQQQYYSDPNVALREQFDRKEINEHTAKIEAKRKEIEAHKKAIADLEDELRRAGKPAAWGRE